MGKGQLLRMQEHGFHSPAFKEEFILFVTTVGPVADDGVEDMVAMPADLMRAAGERPGFDQGVARGGVLAKGDVDLCLFQSFEYGDRISRLALMVGDGIIDRHLLRKPPSDNSQIAFVHLPGKKFILNGPDHFGVQGKQECPAGFSIDAMTGEHMFAHQLTTEDLHCKLLRIHRQIRPMHQEPVGLVHRDEVVVVVEDVKGSDEGVRHNGGKIGDHDLKARLAA